MDFNCSSQLILIKLKCLRCMNSEILLLRQFSRVEFSTLVADSECILERFPLSITNFPTNRQMCFDVQTVRIVFRFSRKVFFSLR